jgi:hypothetical protein
VATAQRTTDHDEIRRWVESRGGHPAIVQGTGGVLRIDFGEPEERLEQVDWDRFFDIFDRSNVAFLYDPQGHMVKFVEESASMASRNGRRKSSSRKKSTNGRKKSSSRKGGRKKSTSSRKKSTGGRKKSTGGRKKSTGGRKKSTGGRKKSTSRKKSSSRKGGRKKSSSGRKYGKKAGRKVERAMHEMKRGELKSGRSGKKVKSRKQAIAIGLSEARRSGGKVPPNPNRRKSSRRKRG